MLVVQRALARIRTAARFFVGVRTALRFRMRFLGGRNALVGGFDVRGAIDLEQVIFAENGELDKKSNPLLTHISDALGYWVHQEWPPVMVTIARSAHVGWL